MQQIMLSNKYSHHVRRHKVNGFTLIEMLVSVVVLSVGLLGLASLQVNSMKMNDSAYYRTQATYLGYDILERMRANRDEMIAGDYNYDSDATLPTGSAIAESDMNQWDQLVNNLLPGAGWDINCDGFGRCAITITWDDSRGLLDPANEATSSEQSVKTVTLNTQI